MKKREGATNIAKLTVLQVSPQTLVTTVRTSEFGLESFGEPLHLPPPLPVFESHELKEWYSGVPLSLMIILRNARFQQLKDTTISFEATSEGRVVFKESHSVDHPIDAQKWVALPINFVCRNKGPMEISVTANFNFDNAPQTLKLSDVMTIRPSVSFKSNVRNAKTVDVIQAQFDNLMPFTLGNVMMSTSDQEVCVGRAIGPGEGVSAYFKGKAPASRVTLSWKLPYATRCVQSLDIRGIREQPPNPVVLELLNVPEVGRCLQPFTVTVRITNTSEEPISGELVFNRSEQLILAVGTSNMAFENLVHQSEFELTLVSLWQGAFPIPPFVINLSDGRTFVSEVNKGVIIVGYGNV